MDDLFSLAQHAAANAYAPYTGQFTGVALALDNGQVYSGSCVENVAYMHGLDALESTLGTMLIKEDWLNTGRLPQIKKLCYYASSKKETSLSPYFPLEMKLLKIFAAPDLSIEIHDQSDLLSVQDDITAYLAAWPDPPFNIDKFIKQSAAQMRHNQPLENFEHLPLKGLFEARHKAFVPVSLYKVAAMVENENGDVFYGINCEPGGNKALHAEATAIAAMVNAKGPKQKIKRVTILTAGDPGFPCGGCRQYIREFSTGDTEIVAMNTDGTQITVPFTTLLPHSFGPEALQSGSGQP